MQKVQLNFGFASMDRRDMNSWFYKIRRHLKFADMLQRLLQRFPHAVEVHMEEFTNITSEYYVHSVPNVASSFDDNP